MLVKALLLLDQACCGDQGAVLHPRAEARWCEMACGRAWHEVGLALVLHWRRARRRTVVQCMAHAAPAITVLLELACS